MFNLFFWLMTTEMKEQQSENSDFPKKTIDKPPTQSDEDMWEVVDQLYVPCPPLLEDPSGETYYNY